MSARVSARVCARACVRACVRVCVCVCVCLLRYKFIGYKYQKLCTAVIRRLVRVYKRFEGNTRRSVYSNKIQTGQESGKKIINKIM